MSRKFAVVLGSAGVLMLFSALSPCPPMMGFRSPMVFGIGTS